MKSLHQVDDLAPSWSLRRSKVVNERLSSKRVPHLAPGRRSIRFVRNSYGARVTEVAPTARSSFKVRRPRCIAQSGCRTPLQDVALPSFVWSGCRRSLPLPALVLYSLKQHFPLPF
ncbi:hypothetical protein F2Q69_00049279 [Brassica cretica]|uniref:Uncharacterized protein n=1 Tax=Brassica cretica TaxID=69181 RepID=A0A8S9PX59_BRACR|nr:hypothetical protein F2Q69_00049279 [Brassica cretica]